MTALPLGWTVAKLGEICAEMRNGISAKPTENTGLPILRISAVRPMSLDAEDVRFLPAEFSGAETYVLRSDDLLFTRYNGNRNLVGACALVRAVSAKVVYPDKLIRVRLAADVAHGAFVEKAAATSLARAFIDGKLKTSAGQVGISGSDLRELPILLPPLGEQRRIAHKFDGLLARVEACRTRLDSARALLKRFRQAVLDAAFRGEVSADWRAENFGTGVELKDRLAQAHIAAGGHRAGNASEPTEGVHDLSPSDFPGSWALATLRECVEPSRPITYGILKPGPEIEGGIPYVRVADFPNDRLDLEGIRYTSLEIDAEFKRSRLRPGDLLLSIRGTVGRVVVIPQALDGANITQDSARLSIQATLCGRFVIWYLRSSFAQSRMRRAIKGVAVRGINIGDVRALQIPIPPRDEQEEIVRRIESLFALAEALERKCQAARAQVDRLTPALLAKAFRGELVPQNPNEEPADVLLARLRGDASKGEGGDAGKRRRSPQSARTSGRTPVPLSSD